MAKHINLLELLVMVITAYVMVFKSQVLAKTVAAKFYCEEIPLPQSNGLIKLEMAKTTHIPLG
jgi:hypothetical protein